MKKKIVFVCLVFLNLLGYSQNNQFLWQNFGPSANQILHYTNTGRVSDFKIVNNGKVMLLSASSAGIWRSVDSGKTWACTSENLPGGANSIEYDEKNGLIFIDFSIYLNGLFKNGFYSYGVFFSDDFGLSWKPTSLIFLPEQLTYIVDIKINKITNELFVLTSDKLYSSKDNGKTWSIVFDAVEHELLEMAILLNNQIVIGGINCLFISKKNNKKFENILPDSLINNTKVKVAAYNNTFWASVQSNNFDKNIIVKSTDFGKTFDIYKHNLSVKWYVNEIFAFNDSLIFVGGIGLRYSTDAGKTFNTITGRFHADIRSVYLPDNKTYNEFYISTDGGLFYTNNAKNFKIISKFSLFQLYSVSVSQQDSFVLLCGAHDNGTLKRDKFGKWLHVLSGDGSGVFVSDSADFMAAYVSKRLSVFRNNKWSYLNVSNSYLGLNPVQNKYYKNIVYAASFSKKRNAGSVLKSVNYGLVFNEDTSTSYGVGLISAINSYCDSSQSFLYASSFFWNDFYFSLYLSSVINDSLKTHRILKINTNSALKITDIFSDFTVGEIYIVFDGFINDKKIWFSNNEGLDWQNLTYNLPNVPVYSVIYIKNLNKLLIGNDWGVYVLVDDKWQRFGENLPFVPVTDFSLNSVTNELFISTYGRGIFVLKL
ncbi:MAG: hypothetical protein JXR68_06860 [Bacteroidales bacterium]|nr:hypothetical protein [Bacteroidales bacterium]